MIIDLHTSIWSSLDQLGPERAAALRRRLAARWGQLDASPDAHEQAMQCVDAAVVMGFRSSRLDACVPAEYIAEFVGKDPGRRIGVAGIDPLAEDAIEQFDIALELGLAGIAVSPPTQGFHPTHSAAAGIYERCEAAGLPLFVQATDPASPSTVMEFGRPTHWDEVARAMPGLRLVLSQLGHPWTDEALLLLGKHEHVFADISGVATRPWQLYNALLGATSLGVMDKLLFGSGFPFQEPAGAIEALYSANAFAKGSELPSIPRAQIRAIVEGDSLACLGIESPITGGARADVDESPLVETMSGAAADPRPSQVR